MAVIGGSYLTLADWASRVDDNYKIATVVELLSQANEILLDVPWVEGNLPTGHKSTIRTGIPQGTWRLLNYGVPYGKSTTAQITDTCGNLEAYALVDKDLADLNGNTAAFRTSEASAFIQGMSQQMAQTLIYGNTATNPERFMGLAPRFNTVTAASAQTAENVIDAGGTGSDNTSIWLVVWGPNTVHGIFPKGKTTGLQHRDLGEDTVHDALNQPYQAYRDHFKWEVGLTVRDWRYIVRICNIDVSDLAGGSPPDLIKLMIRALHLPPTMPSSASNVSTSDAAGISGMMGRAVWYANRTVATWLDIQALNKTNVNLMRSEFAGGPALGFRGIPIRTVDQILNTEARVV